MRRWLLKKVSGEFGGNRRLFATLPCIVLTIAVGAVLTLLRLLTIDNGCAVVVESRHAGNSTMEYWSAALELHHGRPRGGGNKNGENGRLHDGGCWVNKDALLKIEVMVKDRVCRIAHSKRRTAVIEWMMVGLEISSQRALSSFL